VTNAHLVVSHGFIFALLGAMSKAKEIVAYQENRFGMLKTASLRKWKGPVLPDEALFRNAR